MYYIQEADKSNIMEKFFNIVKLENNKIMMPIYKDNIEEKKLYELAVKTKKILDKTNCKKIILSKKLKEQTIYLNYLHTYNYEIVDGKWLFKMLIFDVLEYVISKLKIKEELVYIGIMVNDVSDFALYVIKKLVLKYKRINIVTNHINLFKNIEEEFSEKYGIWLHIGNNKRKSLVKTNIILNLDFPTELINKYNIYNEAIIINFNGNVQIKNKRFNGVNINDYEIRWKDIAEIDKFYCKDLYEAIQYKKRPIEEILKKIKLDKIKIEVLKGNKTLY